MAKWPKLERYAPIEVHWDDISSDPTWNTEAEVDAMLPKKCTSLGYFQNRNDRCLRISYSKSEDGGYSCEVIPIGCVTKIVVLSRRR